MKDSKILKYLTFLKLFYRFPQTFFLFSIFVRENRRKVTLACRLYRLADDVKGFCGGV